MTDLRYTPNDHPGGPIAWAKEMLSFPTGVVSGKEIRAIARQILGEAGIDPSTVRSGDSEFSFRHRRRTAKGPRP